MCRGNPSDLPVDDSFLKPVCQHCGVAKSRVRGMQWGLCKLLGPVWWCTHVRGKRAHEHGGLTQRWTRARCQSALSRSNRSMSQKKLHVISFVLGSCPRQRTEHDQAQGQAKARSVHQSRARMAANTPNISDIKHFNFQLQDTGVMLTLPPLLD